MDDEEPASLPSPSVAQTSEALALPIPTADTLHTCCDTEHTEPPGFVTMTDSMVANEGDANGVGLAPSGSSSFSGMGSPMHQASARLQSAKKTAVDGAKSAFDGANRVRRNGVETMRKLSRLDQALLDKWKVLNHPRVWWRHPVARILIALLILVLDMVLYFEDPVNDSYVEAFLPGAGHIWSLLVHWPSTAGLVFLRLALILVALICGMWLGRQVLHHRILRDYCKLTMFKDCNGTLGPMLLCSAGTGYVAALLYNVVSGENALTGSMVMSMSQFCKMQQCASVSADLVAILMITDAVFQDTHHWPDWPGKWCRCDLKKLWNDGLNGWFRVLTVWIVLISSLGLTYWSIMHAGIGEMFNTTDMGGFTESARATLVSTMIFLDLFTVAQDWDFPSFEKPLQIDGRQILVAGTFLPELNCNFAQRFLSLFPPLPRSLQRLLPSFDFFAFTVTGAWLSYGPLMLVMGIDMFCTKTQLFYEPSTFGQYIEGNGTEPWRIWTIRNETYLAMAYDGGALVHPEMVSFAARQAQMFGSGALADVKLTARHTGTGLRYIAVIPGLAIIPLFFILVVVSNRRKNVETEVKDFQRRISVTDQEQAPNTSAEAHTAPAAVEGDFFSGSPAASAEEAGKEEAQEPSTLC
eukprot:TRINITY_DN27226_c0_g5_i1.p1 TRINITY_DN27226_c0_g5~~TRINITY_DN27226_c0_g5_i1.p1  ORF type:complete len:654 (+),score=94.56 TRINITY_DN27226_c0_g5_i1:50-1963(+)